MNDTSSPAPKRSAAPKVILWAILVLTFLAFVNGLQNGFVYDDNKQILLNPFVKHLSLLRQGLASDVWAFKGPGQTWSNYWRPGFTLWSAVNWQLSGESPLGWHVLNLLLHLIAVGLGFRLLRKLKFSTTTAAFAAAVFAVHPSRVESVTWIAGSPDILAAIALFLSFGKLIDWFSTRNRKALYLAVALFASAVLCKEVFLVSLLIVPLIAGRVDPGLKPISNRTVETLVPFAIVGVVFLIARYQVLGFLSRPYDDSPSWGQTLMTAPFVLLFYLRQVVWPGTLGIMYELEPKDRGDLASPSYWLVLAAAIGFVAAGVLVAKRSKDVRFGLAWFILMLLPAFLIRSFHNDDLVHDRYLYLPMLGFGLSAGAAIQALADRINHERLATIVMAALLLPLIAITALNNRHWQSDVTLWRQAVAVSPDSSRAWTELGSALQIAKQTNEAEEAIRRALALGPPKENAYTIYAFAARDRGDLVEAKRRLEQSIIEFPNYYVAWENLAVIQNQMGDPEGAVATFRRALEKLPVRRELYRVNIAVLKAQDGKPSEAIAELDPIQGQLAASPDPDVRKGLFYLGMLKMQTGDSPGGVQALQSFLRVAPSAQDPQTAQYIEQAREQLRAVGAG